jgi:hypothetical protein
LLPHGAEPLTKTLHDALNIDKSLVWEQLADEFDAVNDVAMHDSVADEVEEDVDTEENARIRVGAFADSRTGNECRGVREGPCWCVRNACTELNVLCFQELTTKCQKNVFPPRQKNIPRVPPPKNAHGSGAPPQDSGCHGGNPRRILRCLERPGWHPPGWVPACVGGGRVGVRFKGAVQAITQPKSTGTGNLCNSACLFPSVMTDWCPVTPRAPASATARRDRPAPRP